MKGTDCTPEQLESAEQFVRGRQDGPHPEIEAASVISVRFEDLVRLVAWYGAIRYTAGAQGLGSCEKPSNFATKEAGVTP